MALPFVGAKLVLFFCFAKFFFGLFAKKNVGKPKLFPVNVFLQGSA
jgi:hypothetical protein